MKLSRTISVAFALVALTSVSALAVENLKVECTANSGRTEPRPPANPDPAPSTVPVPAGKAGSADSN